eukprot:TRINITY_DN898_c0_g1_i5.p1 TRINITY_DN898_c0_g1~~TRINITY_DN898_c0_g1_i5.p1  ORF type:complete len:456 (+),score=50.89 TRINITY_DN898_c0_g1_i5:109-1476(+)
MGMWWLIVVSLWTVDSSFTGSICGDDDLVISRDGEDYFRIDYPTKDVIMCAEEANFCEMFRNETCMDGYFLIGYNLTSSTPICKQIDICDGRELFSNGNFQRDLEGWTVNNPSVSGTSTGTVATESPYILLHSGGTKHLHFGNTGVSAPNFKSIEQDIYVGGLDLANSFFTLSGFYNHNDDFGTWEVYFFDEAGALISSCRREFPKGTSDAYLRHWNPLSVNNIQLPDGTETMRVRFEGFGGDAIGFLLDELSLTCTHSEGRVPRAWRPVLFWPRADCVVANRYTKVDNVHFLYTNDAADAGLSSSTYLRLEYDGTRWFNAPFGIISCGGLFHPNANSASILAFEITPGEEGHYRLESATAIRSDTSGPDDGEIELIISVSDVIRRKLFIAETDGSVPFDMDLGFLKAGDVIYISVGPGRDGNSFDSTQLAFSIQFQSAPPLPLGNEVTDFRIPC